MALGILGIIYILLLVLAVALQILLYKSKGKSQIGIFIVNALFVLLLAYLSFTSLPTNFLGQRILAASAVLIAIIAVVIRLKAKKFTFPSKLMLTLATLGSLALLLL